MVTQVLEKEKAAFLSPWAFRTCWALLLAIHCLVVLYSGMIAWMYSQLPDSYLDRTFQYVGLGLGTHNHAAIGWVHVVSVLPHGIAMLSMMGWSAWKKRLVLTSEYSFPQPKVFQDHTLSVARCSLLSTGCMQAVVRYTKQAGDFLILHLLSRDGIFGVNHKHFDTVLFIRELFETGFQTYQGWRMSWFLSRAWLNRGFVALLVFNCWSTAFVQLWYKRSETKKRLVCLMCDALLDLACSVGIPTVVFVWYWRVYDTEHAGFPEDLWYDDVFLVNVKSELQMVVVCSWFDLVSRVSFVLGLYSSLGSIKDLLRPAECKIQHFGVIGPTLSDETLHIRQNIEQLMEKRATESAKSYPDKSKRLNRVQGVVFGV